MRLSGGSIERQYPLVTLVLVVASKVDRITFPYSIEKKLAAKLLELGHRLDKIDRVAIQIKQIGRLDFLLFERAHRKRVL